MTSGILNAFGGLGVFLLGMIVMTDGLKAMTGNALRSALARFTKSPTSGAITGAISTAIIQSSSGTTVTAVGFVGAGLISFTQALGIIFGANIGTTITGWLVALLGFKLQIGTLALPFVLIGALMHLFSRRHLAALGMSIAGFGLIFVGIDLIQSGMASLEGWVTPDSFPSDGFTGRLLLLMIGVAITLVTQSSSAGVATALAAVHAGTISFEQAAVMVIGMDVGTTATAAIATLGGSPDVRRTGYAHVIYNIMTGIMAFLLVTPYTWFCETVFSEGFEQNPEIALVAFHTFFNTLGVIAVLPFTGAFANLMTWLVPAEPQRYTQRLDRTLYQSSTVALTAVRSTLLELSMVVLDQLTLILKTGQTEEVKDTLKDANEALKATRDFVTPIETSGVEQELYGQKLIAIHTIDHLRRLIDRCQESKRSQRTHEAGIQPLGESLLQTIRHAREEVAELVEASPEQPDDSPRDNVLEEAWRNFEIDAERIRHDLIADAAGGREATNATIRKLDTLRWIRRVSYHIWRIVFYLSLRKPEEQSPEVTPEPE